MNEGRSPDIWLAGDPEDLVRWMGSGVKGIVTNTVVQRELTEKYGNNNSNTIILCWIYSRNVFSNTN